MWIFRAVISSCGEFISSAIIIAQAFPGSVVYNDKNTKIRKKDTKADRKKGISTLTISNQERKKSGFTEGGL